MCEDKEKICADCKYYLKPSIWPWRNSQALCQHPKAKRRPSVNKISGKVTEFPNMPCYLFRMLSFDNPNACNYDAKFFEPKKGTQT